MKGQTTIAQLLINNGANVNAQNKDGNTPLHKASEHGNTEVAKLLIENGANVNAQDKNGLTPLHVAIRYFTEIALLLINKGASLFAKTIKGLHPLDLAQGESTKILLQKVDVNTHDQDGHTPLHYASQKGLSDAAKNLIARGAAINAQDNYGRTPLHYASFYGREDIVNLLLAAGADRDLKDTMGKNAFDTARSQKHEKMFSPIQQKETTSAIVPASRVREQAPRHELEALSGVQEKRPRKETSLEEGENSVGALSSQPSPATHDEDLDSNISEKDRIKRYRTNN
jgi:ankyrin repeat protein